MQANACKPVLALLKRPVGLSSINVHMPKLGVVYRPNTGLKKAEPTRRVTN